MSRLFTITHSFPTIVVLHFLILQAHTVIGHPNSLYFAFDVLSRVRRESIPTCQGLRNQIRVLKQKQTLLYKAKIKRMLKFFRRTRTRSLFLRLLYCTKNIYLSLFISLSLSLSHDIFCKISTSRRQSAEKNEISTSHLVTMATAFVSV